jgi:hypothetical protein
MTKDEALKLALEALEKSWNPVIPSAERETNAKEAIAAVKEALAQPPLPVQEPVAWMYWQSCLNDDGTQTAPWVQRYSKFKPPESVINKEITPLYTTPPAPVQPERTWVGLTDDEINACDPSEECWGLLKIARVIETKLKEKNT